MARRGMLFVVLGIFLLSLGSLLFFLFRIDPEYLNFSGFLLFYALLFAFFWSIFCALGYVINRRKRVPFSRGLLRRSALLSLLVVGGIFLKQFDLFSRYTIGGLAVAVVFVEVVFLRRS